MAALVLDGIAFAVRPGPVGMTGLAVTFEGAEILREGRLAQSDIGLADGGLAEVGPGRRADLTGYLLLPGIVDLHGDGFERHVAPRRGAMMDPAAGIWAAEAKLAANGITIGVLAQFFSWKGELRGWSLPGGSFGPWPRYDGSVRRICGRSCGSR